MSSDSEDDCYGNIAQKLTAMKNKYHEEDLDTTNLLNDSEELDEVLKIAVKKSKIKPKKAPKNAPAPREEIAGPSVSDLPDVSLRNAVKNTSKRKTRSSTKNSPEMPTPELPPSRSRRKTLKTAAESSEATPSPRARGRGRGNRGRGRRATPRGRYRGRWRNLHTVEDFFETMFTAMTAYSSGNIPTYSVGNTEEYPDQSDNQTLFSNKPNDVVVMEENNSLDENEELSVKVYWQSSEFFKFTIRRYQKLTQIFDYFSHKENVTHDKLLFTFNEKILTPNDSPDSINYNIVKFIDGGIVNLSVSEIVKKDEKIKDGVNIKFQCQNVKKPFEITVRFDDKLSVAMMKFAEQLETPLEKLRFEFDGDCISGKITPRELELEGGECIDVKIIS